VLLGQKLRRVDQDVGVLLLFSLLFREISPQLPDERLLLSLLEKDGDDGQMTACVGVDEVNAHLVPLPWIFSSLGRWKWNCWSAYCRSPTRSELPARSDHYGVAVIDDAQGRRMVVELERRKIGLLRRGDVDRRLVVPHLARRELRLEMFPSGRDRAGPVVPVVFLRRRARRHDRECGRGRERFVRRVGLVFFMEFPSATSSACLGGGRWAWEVGCQS
jgi:hypothetical protein